MFAYAPAAGPGGRRRSVARDVARTARTHAPWDLAAHQRRDDYWRHASVCENYRDGPSRCWPERLGRRLLQRGDPAAGHLDVPRKGLIGPWSHKYPHLGEPGPAIGYLQEVVRWWDHWLKGIDNGVMDGPMLQTWMQESVPPSTSYEERPGRWVGEPYVALPAHPGGHAPAARPTASGRPSTAARIRTTSPAAEPMTVQSPLSVGQFAGKWAS